MFHWAAAALAALSLCVGLCGCAAQRLPYMAMGGMLPYGVHYMTQGTGFFIDDRGGILTAAHVTEDCVALAVSGPSFGTVPAWLVARADYAADLALITAPVRPPAVAQLVPSWTGPDKPAAITAYPLRVFGYPKSDTGTAPFSLSVGEPEALLQRFRTETIREVYDKPQSAIFAGAPIDIGDAIWGMEVNIEGGYSGSPLADATGRVVGIVSASTPLDFSYAHVSDAAIGFLRRLAVPLAGQPKGPVADSVVRISCYRANPPPQSSPVQFRENGSKMPPWLRFNHRPGGIFSNGS